MWWSNASAQDGIICDVIYRNMHRWSSILKGKKERTIMVNVYIVQITQCQLLLKHLLLSVEVELCIAEQFVHCWSYIWLMKVMVHCVRKIVMHMGKHACQKKAKFDTISVFKKYDSSIIYSKVKATSLQYRLLCICTFFNVYKRYFKARL